MALLRSLVRMVPVLGRIGRPVHALSPAAGSRLMTLGRPDSIHSEELLARQREKIDRMRMDYNHTREKLTRDMDAFLELMRRDSEDSEKIFDIKEKAIHLVFFGFPLVLLIICVKYDINVLVAWGTLF